MVSPTISGRLVEARGQVFITVFCPERLTTSTFRISLGSTAEITLKTDSVDAITIDSSQNVITPNGTLTTNSLILNNQGAGTNPIIHSNSASDDLTINATKVFISNNTPYLVIHDTVNGGFAMSVILILCSCSGSTPVHTAGCVASPATD